jgi:hypothetical protein
MTYIFMKQRERDADCRKMKLEQYREYIVALSGFVEGRDTPDGHTRYVDAVNSMTLVASTKVLRALYQYTSYTSSRGLDETPDTHDRVLSDLINALRDDVMPGSGADTAVRYHLITVPPHLRIDRSEQEA